MGTESQHAPGGSGRASPLGAYTQGAGQGLQGSTAWQLSGVWQHPCSCACPWLPGVPPACPPLPAGIQRYERVFGEGFVSPGGLDTHKARPLVLDPSYSSLGLLSALLPRWVVSGRTGQQPCVLSSSLLRQVVSMPPPSLPRRAELGCADPPTSLNPPSIPQDVCRLLNLQPDEQVLDVGCGLCGEGGSCQVATPPCATASAATLLPYISCCITPPVSFTRCGAGARLLQALGRWRQAAAQMLGRAVPTLLPPMLQAARTTWRELLAAMSMASTCRVRLSMSPAQRGPSAVVPAMGASAGCLKHRLFVRLLSL